MSSSVAADLYPLTSGQEYIFLFIHVRSFRWSRKADYGVATMYPDFLS